MLVAILGLHMATRLFVYLTGLLAGISMASPVVAQTQVDLRTQSRNIDFGAAPSTRPLKTGTALPSSCLVGDMFFSSSSPADKNLYGCTSLNTWTPQAEVISPSGVANYVLAFTNQTALSISAAMHGGFLWGARAV